MWPLHQLWNFRWWFVHRLVKKFKSCEYKGEEEQWAPILPAQSSYIRSYQVICNPSVAKTLFISCQLPLQSQNHIAPGNCISKQLFITVKFTLTHAARKYLQFCFVKNNFYTPWLFDHKFSHLIASFISNHFIPTSCNDCAINKNDIKLYLSVFLALLHSFSYISIKV